MSRVGDYLKQWDEGQADSRSAGSVRGWVAAWGTLTAFLTGCLAVVAVAAAVGTVAVVWAWRYVFGG